MRTTLIIDDALFAKAQELSGLHDTSAVLHEGLRAIIARESARRLVALGGTEPAAKSGGRRRMRKAR